MLIEKTVVDNFKSNNGHVNPFGLYKFVKDLEGFQNVNVTPSADVKQGDTTSTPLYEFVNKDASGNETTARSITLWIKDANGNATEQIRINVRNNVKKETYTIGVYEAVRELTLKPPYNSNRDKIEKGSQIWMAY